MATTSVFIQPKSPLVPEIIKLSPIDQFTIRIYVATLLIFKLSPDSSHDTICSQLQHGLGELLNDMPFLAGNVVEENKERGTLELEIPENAGVLFNMKDMADPKNGPIHDFDSLKRAWFPSSLLGQLTVGPVEFVPGPVAPCLAVQANFIHGGLILAVYIHHSIVDGFGAATMLNDWSKHVAAFSEARLVHISERTPPQAMDRSPLFPDARATHALVDFPGFAEPQNLSMVWCDGQDSDTDSAILMDDDIKQPPALTMAYWYISNEKMRELEKKSNPTSPTAIKRSESNILSAFIWRHYSRAILLNQPDVQEVSFFMCCDGRARMDPPLDPGFLGNGTVHTKATISVAQLFSPESDGLYNVASTINDSIEWWTSDRISDLLNSMEDCPCVHDVQRSSDVCRRTDLEITNTSTFPLFDFNWGSALGKPLAYRFPDVCVIEGLVAFLPRLLDGGIEFAMYLNVETLGILGKDEEFTSYVQFRCS